MVAAKKVNITDSTMFLKVSFGLPGNTKKIPTSAIHINSDESPENGANNGYSAKMVKAQKTLLESPELEAIRKADGQIRTYLYNVCLPWDLGVLLLPYGLIEQVSEKLEAYGNVERPALVDAFIDAYPERIDKALASLGPLGNSADYPSSATMRGKFSFDWQPYTVSIPEVLKEKGIYDIANEKMQAKLSEASDEITAFMRETLYELTSHLADALTPNADGKPKRLFASAITNITDFLETFQARNITEDSDLEAIVSNLKGLLKSDVQADVLKKDASLKDAIRAQMESVSAELKTLVEVIPGRKMREEV
jgi:hypothetical protein